MTSWVDQVVLARKEDAAEIARLRAENARLRGWIEIVNGPLKPGDEQRIQDAWGGLRAALKEGGGE